MSPCPVAVGRLGAFRALAVIVLPAPGPALGLVRPAAARAKEDFVGHDFRFELEAQGTKKGGRVTFGFGPSQASIIGWEVPHASPLRPELCYSRDFEPGDLQEGRSVDAA